VKFVLYLLAIIH